MDCGIPFILNNVPLRRLSTTTTDPPCLSWPDTPYRGPSIDMAAVSPAVARYILGVEGLQETTLQGRNR